MRIVYTNTGQENFGDAFFNNSTGEVDADVISARGVVTNTVVVQNASNGFTTTLTGSNMFITPDGDPLQGLITGISITDGGGTLVETITQISWPLTALVGALIQLETDDLSGIAALINQSSTITFDASAAGMDFDHEDGWQDLSSLLTTPITYIGSPYRDWFQGGMSDDTVDTGSGTAGGDYNGNEHDATPGNDVYQFGNVSPTTWTWISYDDFRTGGIFNVDIPANTATVQIDGHTQTWLNPRTAAEADGLSWSGGTGNDVFNVNGGDGFIGITALEGNDIFNLQGDYTFRLSYNWGEFSAPTGIVADLETGIVQDGLGGTDQINWLGGSGRITLRGSDANDSMAGSSRDDRFITEQGNDTVDGRGGDDEMRYDRDGVGPMFVDLAAGTASGTWDGFGFTDTLISIERVRGSRNDNDTLLGSGANETLEGRGGDDSIDGRAGDDELRGDDGNDTLIGGDGIDTLRGGDGNDRLDASGGSAATQGFGDIAVPGYGNDTILGHVGLWNEGDGIEIAYWGMPEDLTVVVGANGSGTVTGNGINDTFTYADFFALGSGDDRVTGSTEDKWEGFQGRAGNDTIDGGASGGDNWVGYNSEHFDGGTSGINANMATGMVTDTFGDTDTLININHLRGSIFDDVITAAGASFDNVWINGDDGDDTITGSSNNDWLEGGEGTDLVIFAVASTSITVTVMGNGLHIDSALGSDHVEGFESYQFTDRTLTHAELEALVSSGGGSNDIIGTPGDDLLNATSDDERIDGLAGDDTINNTGGGSDTFVGGDGTDLLITDTSTLSPNDILFLNLLAGTHGALNAPGSHDTVEGIENFTLIGDWDGDLTGDDNANHLISDAGNDTLIGNGGDDTLQSDEGNDSLSGGGGNDLLEAGDGDDTLTDGTGFDTIDGGDGIDLFTRDYGGNFDFIPVIDLMAGRIYDQADPSSFEVIHMVENTSNRGMQHHVLIGSDVANHIITGAGDDTLTGNGGDDTLEGGGGTDTAVFGVASTDVTFDDSTDGLQVISTEGTDLLLGIETLQFTDGSFAYETLFPGEDLPGSPGADTIPGTPGDDNINGRALSDRIDALSGDDLVNGGTGFDTILGGAGDDTITGADGYDSIEGNAGNDVITGNNGFDTVDGGAGNDTLLGGLTPDLLLGGADDDSVLGQAGGDTVEGGDGNDTLDGNAGADEIFGDAGDDLLNGGINFDLLSGGDGDDTLNAGNGGDTLLGGAGDDMLEGNGGHDRLNGGAGNDLLRGGIGIDTFVFEAGGGHDTVRDFANNFDMIELDLALFTETSAGDVDLRDYASVNGNGNLVLTFATGDSLTVNGIDRVTPILDDYVIV